ncbi:MAG: sulfatase-like hydrolase/transferase [Gammaproteobacteria bacterium]|nr:sulfatase-like hydrolase/transferase [Gammaproteobacteria bacterium]
MKISLPQSLTRIQKTLLLLSIAMVVFSIVRFIFWLSYPDAFSQLSVYETISAFVNGLRFDGSVFARFIILPFILMAFPLAWLDKRAWFDIWAWLFFIVLIGSTLLLLADIIYFEHVKRHLAYELILIKDDINFVFDFMRHGYIGALVLFALFTLALGWVWLTILRRPIKKSNWAPVKYIATFLFILIIGRGGVSGKLIEIIDAYGTGNSAYGHLSLNGVFTTMAFALNMDNTNHHFFSEEEAIATLGKHRTIIDPEYPLMKKNEGKATGYNVVFVLLESWNFDHVDSFGNNGYKVTPNFDALAAEGIRFTHFYAAGQRSIEGVQTTLTGIPALKGLPRLDAGIGVSNFTRLGSIAKDNGYETLFVQSSNRDSFKISGITAAAGFEYFYGREDIPLIGEYPDPEEATFGWDYDTLMFFKSKLDGLKEPFLAYTFTGTTHEPYADPGKKFHVQPHNAQGEAGFLNTVKYADWSLGQFIAAAKKQPWFDNTIFIFTADHANHLQKGGFLKSFHTPLLIYSPKLFKAKEDKTISSQLDIMPTIIELLGFTTEYTSVGESIFNKKSGYAFTTMGGTAIAIINDKAYLKHSLKNRLEAEIYAPEKGTVDFDAMEKHLLSLDQMSYELLRDNRWSR